MYNYSGIIENIRNLGGICFLRVKNGISRQNFILEGKSYVQSLIRDINIGDYCVFDYEIDAKGEKVIKNVSNKIKRNNTSRIKYSKNEINFSLLHYCIEKVLRDQKSVRVFPPTILKGDSKGDTFKLNFFNEEARLSSSGALYLDSLACEHVRVHAISRVFRAERSHSRRHLSEFTLLESACLGYDMNQSMDYLELILKETFSLYADNAGDYVSEKLKNLLLRYDRISYEDLVRRFNVKPSNYAVFEKHCPLNRPTFVYNLPVSLASWRALRNSHHAFAFNLLLPQLGEVAEGSVRTADYTLIEKKLIMSNMTKQLSWLKKYLCFKKGIISNFGVGIERCLMSILDLQNIREIYTFYRTDKFSEI